MVLLHWPVPMKHTGDVGDVGDGTFYVVNEEGDYGYDTSYGLIDAWWALEELVGGKNKVKNIGLCNADANMVFEIMTRRKNKNVRVR